MFVAVAEETRKMELGARSDLSAEYSPNRPRTTSRFTPARPKIGTLSTQSAGLSNQFDAIKDATETTGDSVKAGTKKACGELKDGFNSSRQWISDKIAPAACEEQIMRAFFRTAIGGRVRSRATGVLKI